MPSMGYLQCAASCTLTVGAQAAVNAASGFAAGGAAGGSLQSAVAGAFSALLFNAVGRLAAVHPDLFLPVLQIIHRAIATTVSASDPLSWGAGTECEAAKGGGAGTAADCDHTGARRRLRAYADRQRAVAHDLGALVETRSWNCDIDIEQCPQCDGQLKLIAAIEEPAAIQRILTHLGLPARPPPRVPVRRSTTARANARMGWKSGALGQNIASDVEKMAGVQWMGTRLTARASSDTFMIREKGGLEIPIPNLTFRKVF